MTWVMIAQLAIGAHIALSLPLTKVSTEGRVSSEDALSALRWSLGSRAVCFVAVMVCITTLAMYGGSFE